MFEYSEGGDTAELESGVLVVFRLAELGISKALAGAEPSALQLWALAHLADLLEQSSNTWNIDVGELSANWMSRGRTPRAVRMLMYASPADQSGSFDIGHVQSTIASLRTLSRSESVDAGTIISLRRTAEELEQLALS